MQGCCSSEVGGGLVEAVLPGTRRSYGERGGVFGQLRTRGLRGGYELEAILGADPWGGWRCACDGSKCTPVCGQGTDILLSWTGVCPYTARRWMRRLMRTRTN